MATPNLGLTIPVGGSTPGASNNTTPGTYPYIFSTNLNLIDSLCYSLNNPAVTAGININADLTFNGHSLLSANNGSFSGTLTVGTLSTTNLSLSGTLNVTGTSTLGVVNASGTSTLGVVNASGLMTLSGAGTALSVTNNATVGGTLNVSSLANKIAISGASTGNDPTITVTGDATIGLTVQTSGTGFASGLQILSGGTPTLIGQLTSAGSAIWLGFSTSTALSTNYSIATDGSGNTLFNASGGILAFRSSNTDVFRVGANLISSMGGAPIVQNAASTSLTLKGNAAATGGIATILDNAVAQTSGTITSFRTNAVEKANIDWTGNLNLTAGGGILTGGSNPLPVTTNVAAAGATAITFNQTTAQTSGTHTVWQESGATIANLNWQGEYRSQHLLASNATIPNTLASPAGWGGLAVAGGDTAFTISAVGVVGSPVAGAQLLTGSWGKTYTNAPIAIVQPATQATAAVWAAGSAGQPYITTTAAGFTILTAGAITTAAVAYKFQVLVIGF